MMRRDLIFRVFVSSTFSDLIEERNALQEKAFPALRKYCQERRARFQAIDLRWGVSQEAALDQQTMNICLQELKRCQVLSPRPNFIVLLGNRNGWRPLPAQIEAGEFEELLSRVPDSDKPLLTTDGSVLAWRDGEQTERMGWYRKDLNAVPATYVLQERTIVFPQKASDDDRRRIRQEESRDWASLEGRMRVVLLAAIGRAGWAGDDPRRFKYEASATHQEIRAGALEADDPQEHVFCYFRETEGLPEDESAATYRDIRDGVIDADAEARLFDLKADLVRILPREHVHTYCAHWRNGRPEYDRSDLCDDVERDLKTIIDREVAAFRQKPALEHEREAHHEFAEERCRHFVGRQDILQRISDYTASSDRRPLVIHGKSGSGKTAVMAKASSELGIRNAERAVTEISRFIGATPGSSDLRTLLSNLCRELGMTDIPQDMNELVRAFRAQLSTEQDGGEQGEGEKPASEDQKRIVLFLDALDQLNPTDNARMLYWMPRELKPNVKIVVSVLQSDEQQAQSADTRSRRNSALRDDPFDLARRIWPESLVEIGSLDETSASELLDAWLQEAGRTLQADQRTEVLGKFAMCPLPLYLKLASEEAFRWKSWEGVPEPLSHMAKGILEQLLARLERPETHGQTLVSRSLGYLAAGKNGLTEDELLDVLSENNDVVQDLSKRSPESPRVDRLPVIVWSRLFADLRPYMTTRRADGTVVMDFYHRQVGEAVWKRYLSDEEGLVHAHQHLADYFDTLDYWAESLEAQRARARRLPPTPRPANVRKVVELPYHRLEAAKLGGRDDPQSPYWDAVADLLTDWRFLEAKAEADPNATAQEGQAGQRESEAEA